MRLRMAVVNLLNLFVAAVEVILGLRFVLKLFGANDNNDLVSWVYEMSSGLLAPFRGIFPTQVFENRYVVELTTLFAMLIYALVALLTLALIDAVTAPAAVEDNDDVVTTKTVRKKRR